MVSVCRWHYRDMGKYSLSDPALTPRHYHHRGKYNIIIILIMQDLERKEHMLGDGVIGGG